MTITVVPSIELIHMQQRGVIDLDDELDFFTPLKVALARDTFHPDEADGSVVAWTTVSARNGFSLTRPTVPNGHIYEALNTGFTGVGEPVFPTDGGTILDGGVTWRDIGFAVGSGENACGSIHIQNAMPGLNIADWLPGNLYSVGDFVLPTTVFEDPRRRYMVCTVGGISGGGEPVWTDTMCDTVVDGAATWTVGVTQANIAQHPFISELEITEDVTTVGYTLGGLPLLAQDLEQRGRGWLVQGNDTDFGLNTTISAAWAVLFLDKVIVGGGATWYYPPLFYGLLNATRTNIVSDNGTFLLDWNVEGIARIR